MAEAEYTTSARLPVEAVWEFVREMDRWAPLLTGYRSHRKEGPDDSVWVLQGDVGVLSRRVELRVHVTEWAGPERVRFTLAGLNEPLAGEGEFTLARGDGAAPAPAAAPRGLFARAAAALARWLFRLVHGGAPRRDAADATTAGAGGSRLTFRLRLEPGGPMAPMLNALLAPALRPAAEDLAEKIVARLAVERGPRG